MAQFDYLGTWDDSWAILAEILEPGDVAAIPDLNYEEPNPLYVTVLDESFKELVRARRSLFLSSKLFAAFPPSMQRIEAGTLQAHYRVDSSREGPLLHLTLPACYRYDASGMAISSVEGGPGLHLAPGMLSHQRQYQNPESECWEAASVEVKAGFKEMVRRMKTRLVRHKFHVPIWIGRDALNQVQEHAATIHGFGSD